MTALQHVKLGTYYVVPMASSDDFEEWRDHARRLLMADVPPDRVAWTEPGGQAGDLFTHGDRRLPVPDRDAPPPRVSRRFMEIAKTVLLNSDSTRFSLLYRVLWRLQAKPKLIEDAADPDVRAMAEMAREVRRDIHKMRAFVRFRVVEEENGGEHYVAWFEPFHHILRHNAGFFTRRFANMRWSILTPHGSLHWDGETLREGPPATRADAPNGDPAEDLWRSYYASIFNPARLKVGAMLKEMPRKYWKNMPEAQIIPELIAGAQAREATMVEKGALDMGERPETLDAIDKAIHACARCPIGELHNTAVMGEGPQDAVLMIVGEQPGDQEDLQGRPFVGPAGQLLDVHLAQAGIDRGAAYVTNTVKHFKYVQRGKRRLHQNPSAKEIDVCRWWVESERMIVQPKLVLAMGASAARGMLGKTVSISKVRGAPIPLEDGSELWVTAHPSYLLRLDGAGREEQERLFRADLAAVAARLTELA
ncbi:UdgX family uracil-DNA binding protein [Croceicoccus naphthovorans]|uniref:Type-4 uracil-DNA glycosylase n=1 Tax=Croceicoccus naphthovorans TaxID=1348774 RepID=A0A0G3XGK6_9SPHN|nr:UdgX family uracil-DNA binding protein [Croceicoccus naphthovorans]AKM09744.1 DNA polymerase [Croceicoccus naphthovorans]MBB3990715.1 DNA polymerase [Croceicoccus naphthovorans]